MINFLKGFKRNKIESLDEGMRFFAWEIPKEVGDLNAREIRIECLISLEKLSSLSSTS